MKKTISLVFLLLAVGALLAHSAVPHHHHRDVAICLSVDHCLDIEAHNDDAGHQHNCNDTDECFIKKTLTVSMKRDHSQACACCFTSVALLLAYFNPEPGIRDDDGVPFRQRPFVETYHYEYLTRSLGLRAPPVC